MIPSKKDRHEVYAPDEAVQPTPARDWKEIAEEASNEQDGRKLLELTSRLIAALDQQTTAAHSFASGMPPRS